MILLVGTADEYLIQKAKEYSDNPILVTESNWTEVIDVGYTGIEEFNDKLLLLNVLLSASKILYYPDNTIAKFDLSFPTECARGLLENILLAVDQYVPVTNLKNQLLGTAQVDSDTALFLALADQRKTKNPQLWAVGCSYTYGTGVNPSERYPALISNQLSIPVSNLSLPGTSIQWAADQILRSDIKKGDTIIWGLTNKQRMSWVWQEKILNITIVDYIKYKHLEKIFPKKLLIDEKNSLYQSIIHIHQVINFCNKVDAKLLLVGLLTGPTDLLYLHNLPNFYQYFNKDNFNYVDFGTDNLHPGPLQHQDYARAIYEQLHLRKWI